MPVNKRQTLVLIAFLAFLVGVLVFWKFFIGKPKETPEVLPTPTPTPTIIPVITPTISKEGVINLLPIITENYTIQYLPRPQKFLVLILKNPFEKYKLEVEEWFRLQGMDPKDPSISWGSAKGVAPKTP
ncbi:MAG: hypothetical protein ACOZBZ_00835 [Patescibacteria group bacterium]